MYHNYDSPLDPVIPPVIHRLALAESVNYAVMGVIKYFDIIYMI